MVHYGKHIIDPDTGLCEICDRGAVHSFRKGKQHPGKHFLYSNQNGKFTYRSTDDEINNYEEPRPRYVRKPLYPEPPPPPARSRATVYEEPPYTGRKSTRRDHSPLEDNQLPPPRPTTFYYVDNTGQMLPRNEGPPDEPPPHYPARHQSVHHQPAQHHPVQHHPVQHHHSPPERRPTRTIQRRAHTPPPPASETRRPQARRINNSDPQIIERHQRAQPVDSYSDISPRRAEMYYVESTPHNHQHFSTIDALVRPPPNHNNNVTPSPRRTHQGDTYKTPRQLEPIERSHYIEPESTVVRKVYKKMPANKHENPKEQHLRHENHVEPVRKIEKIYPSPRSTGRHARSPLPYNNNPSIYYIQSVNDY